MGNGTRRRSATQLWVLRALVRGGDLRRVDDTWRLYPDETADDWSGVAQRTIDVLVRDHLLSRGRLTSAGRRIAHHSLAAEPATTPREGA